MTFASSSLAKAAAYGAAFTVLVIIQDIVETSYTGSEVPNYFFVLSLLLIIVQITLLWLLLKPLAKVTKKFQAGLAFGLVSFILSAVWVVGVFPALFPNYYEELKNTQLGIIDAEDTLTVEERELAVELIESATNPTVTAGIEFFSLAVMTAVYVAIIVLVQKIMPQAEDNESVFAN